MDHARPAIFNLFYPTARVKQLLKFCDMSKDVIDMVRDREFASGGYCSFCCCNIFVWRSKGQEVSSPEWIIKKKKLVENRCGKRYILNARRRRRVRHTHGERKCWIVALFAKLIKLAFLPWLYRHSLPLSLSLSFHRALTVMVVMSRWENENKKNENEGGREIKEER